MAEATYRGDIVEVGSSHLENKSIGFLHETRNAETGEIAATCKIMGVHMDRQARKSALFAPSICETAMKHPVTFQPAML